MAIRNFLIAQQTANLERANSGASVGEPALTPESAGDEADGLDEFLGPLQAEVVRHLWRAKRPQPTSAVLEALNARRSRPIGYTTLQTTMARLASKKILHRYAAGDVTSTRSPRPTRPASPCDRSSTVMARQP